ncbi:hypothetical protein CBU02nite_32450 [Clostridium butyricum]|uniref:DUF5348 domain-containing protein n=1 Tax=Clostridium butyricum TaxID=1492 RepID=A0A512TR74_CLOBU|nr:hypothetical protein [Clostridium butyricum]NOW22124.1 hypothetical protein [Clostridium butyricum]GEQ22739.1 hypothetical protein CBU02nite_32450 [Clostridium butyricum]
MINQISFWDKQRVVFIEDDTKLHEDFKLGSEFEVFMEQEHNYIILHDGVFYGPLKEECK